MNNVLIRIECSKISTFNYTNLYFFHKICVRDFQAVDFFFHLQYLLLCAICLKPKPISISFLHTKLTSHLQNHFLKFICSLILFTNSLFQIISLLLEFSYFLILLRLSLLSFTFFVFFNLSSSNL